jgi:hypothetical protein
MYEDGTWQIKATYTKSVSLTATYDEDGGEQSDDDRYERRVVVAEEPIMTHPVAMLFPTKEKNKLANLLANNVEANLNYDPAVEANNKEFVTLNAQTGEMDVKVEFGELEVTKGDVTSGCSPALLTPLPTMKAGVLATNTKHPPLADSWE